MTTTGTAHAPRKGHALSGLFCAACPIVMLVLLASRLASAATYYVAPNGSDTAAGGEATPWSSIAHAQTVVASGDTVYFRAGKYAYTSGTKLCASGTDNISGIALTKSGAPGQLIHYSAFPGEVPVFDFSGIKDSCRVKGFMVSASWIHLKGLEVTGVPQNNNLNHESWGVWVTGGNNLFELLNIHHIMGTGLFIQDGGNNLVLNCDSHHNYDPLTSNGAGQSGDGFGCHIAAGNPGNVFRGCRAWMNSDDGYDVINAFESVTIEDSWAWQMGYLPGTFTPLPAGNGNGFKSGGYGADPTRFPTNPPRHVIRNDLAFLCKAAGFYANHHPVSSFFYDNTSYDNGSDFNMLGMSTSGASITVGVYRNNVAFSPAGKTLLSNNTFSTADDANNSWTLPITLADSDFQSVSPVGADGPRQADGSLPCLGFLRPQAASSLIGKGKDVSVPPSSSPLDLGAFQHGACVALDAGASAGNEAGASGSSSGSGSGSSGVAASGSSSGTGASGSSSGLVGSSGTGGDVDAAVDATVDSSLGDANEGGPPVAAAPMDVKNGGCSCDAVGADGRAGREACAAVGLLAAMATIRARRASAGRGCRRTGRPGH